MKAKLIPIILMMILLCSLGLAVEKFDGDVNEDTETDVGGKTITARYYEANDKISLHIIEDEKYLLVEKGSCEESGLWSYCFNAATEEEEEIEKNGQTLLNTYYVLDMTVYSQSPEIELVLTLSEDEPAIDTTFELMMQMTNEGDLDSSNVQFTMKIPENIEIISTDGATIYGDQLIWSTPIQKTKTKEKTARFRATDFGEYSFEATAEYDSAGVMTTTEVTAEIEVSFPYNTSTSLSLDLVAQNEASVFTLSIGNPSTEKLQVNNIEIKMPSKLDVKSVPSGFTIMRNVLSGSTTIDPGDSQDFDVKIQTGSKGEYEIETILDIRLGSREFHEKLTDTFGVAVSGVVPIINISDKNPKSYDAVDIDVYFQNRAQDNITTEVIVKSSLFDRVVIDETTYEPGSIVLLTSKTITAPKADVSFTGYVEAYGSYVNDRGITFEYSTREEITIQATEKVVKITQDVVVDGDEVDVVVTLENLKTNTFEDVEIFDLLPRGFKVEGEQSGTVTLTALGKEEALRYKIIVPSDYDDNNFFIEHTVNVADDSGELLIQESSLRVDLAGRTNAAAEDEVIVEENDTVTVDDILSDIEDAEEEKPGVFSRIWTNIKGVFNVLFGRGD